MKRKMAVFLFVLLSTSLAFSLFGVPLVAPHNMQAPSSSLTLNMQVYADSNTTSNTTTNSTSNSTNAQGFSWGFLGSIGSGIAHGMGWLYNNTVGAFTNWLQGATLSLAETVAEDGASVLLTFFELIAEGFDGIMGGFFSLIISTAEMAGVFGPMFSVVIFVGIVVVAVIVIRLVVDLM